MAESQVNTSEGVKKPSSNTILYVIIGVLVVCIIAMGVSNGMFEGKEISNEVKEDETTETPENEEKQEEEENEGVIEVDAFTLRQEYSGCPFTARDKYLNKNVKVTNGYFYRKDEGQVPKILYSFSIIALNDYEDYVHANKSCSCFRPVVIMCHLTDSFDQNKLQGYKIGSPIEIQGKVVGYDYDGGIINMENCDVL